MNLTNDELIDFTKESSICALDYDNKAYRLIVFYYQTLPTGVDIRFMRQDRGHSLNLRYPIMQIIDKHGNAHIFINVVFDKLGHLVGFSSKSIVEPEKQLKISFHDTEYSADEICNICGIRYDGCQEDIRFDPQDGFSLNGLFYTLVISLKNNRNLIFVNTQVVNGIIVSYEYSTHNESE